ncbi:claudin domain-containing protein 1a isoform X2 [Hoplias malabaricus]|uniref:claudin domain-containing protein 1a isoform X2 n=1 Tax=Hoplias malabaricus TaxID=27720 RepID=UPI0034619309
MVDNRYATALVIACVLSALASVYLSVAVGTQHWYQYSSPPVYGEPNASELRSLHEEFSHGEFDEKTYSDSLFRLNGTLGLWWRCLQVPTDSHWYKEPDPKMVMECVSFTLSQQFTPKYKEPGNHNSGEDMIRTYLWRCQFLLPLVSLGLVLLSGLVGFCACLCRSLSPTLGIGLLHLLAENRPSWSVLDYKVYVLWELFVVFWQGWTCCTVCLFCLSVWMGHWAGRCTLLSSLLHCT